MFRYNNIGFGMEFPLPRINNLYKGYSIICQCELIDSKESSKDYKVEFWIKYENIDTLIRTDIEPAMFKDLEARELKTELCKTVELMYTNGSFNNSINDYEYILKCFDEGNNVLSQEEIA